VLERAASRIPIPKDGADGVPLDGFEAELADDGRTLVLRLTAGEVKKEARLVMPVVIDRGIFKDGAAYMRGDCADVRRDDVDRDERCPARQAG
jgi:hypothetical protein